MGSQDSDSTNLGGPAPSPELPITLHVDGNLPAVDFVRRLHRAGLELINSDDGAYAVLRLAAKDPAQALREQLFQAGGIVVTVRAALASNMETHATPLQDALQAAWRILDDVAAALEGGA